MDETYAVGEHIEIRSIDSGMWISATIIEKATYPYGWYVRYDGCSSAWIYPARMRKIIPGAGVAEEFCAEVAEA
jgi:hypothetical protein